MIHLKSFIKKIITEAISTDASYKQHIKSLFEQWVNKLSASYMQYREQNYPISLIIDSNKSITYAEDFQHQHIKLLFNDVDYTDSALIFEYDGSIYIANDKTLTWTPTLVPSTAQLLDTAYNITYWHNKNWLFKLSISDFETAMSVADSYEEFITLCEELSR